MGGRVYPVTEYAGPGYDDPANFYGKPLKDDYDSHYLLVHRIGANGFPCPPDQSIDGDELCVRSPSQILPRYIVQFDDLNDSSTSPSPSPPSLTDYVVMWIDPDHSQYNASVVQLMKAATDLRLEVVQVSSSAEARSWLLRDATTVRALIAADR